MSSTVRWRALLSAVAFATIGLGTLEARAQGEAETLSATFRKAARRVLPAVVTVRPLGVQNPFESVPPGMFGRRPRRFDSDEDRSEAGGSGVIIDAAKGFILTNDHLVQNTSRVVVILGDGHERNVSQIRRDPKSDLALLIVDPKGLTQADWGDSDALDTGDWVLAIGHPFGLSDTVTAGIVSGKGRGIGVAMYEDLIQTDAAINPGNSGGPLVNMKGEVVGINAAIKTMGGGYEGIGFAIPAARARRISTDLAGQGKVQRAFLGVQIGAVDRATGERLNQPGAVAINGITPGSPAAGAGLRRGDVILSLEGKPVTGLGALQGAIEFAPIDRPLKLTIDRDGQSQDIEVVPKPQPDSYGLPEDAPDFGPRRFRERFREPFSPPAQGFPGQPPLIKPADERESPVNPARRTEELAKYLAERKIDRGELDAITTTDVRVSELGVRLSEPFPNLGGPIRRARPAHGLTIVSVEPASPAARGELEIGMVITHVGSRPVESLGELRDALAKRPKDAKLVVRILKGNEAEFRVLPGLSETTKASLRAPSSENESRPSRE